MLVAFLDNFALQIVERQQLKMEQLHSQVQVSRSRLNFSALLGHRICFLFAISVPPILLR